MTLLTEAKKGLNDDIKNAARSEGISSDKLRRLIAGGRSVIPKNGTHDIAALGIGEALRTKVNANIGTSRDYIDKNEELAKARIALSYGADTVMDLSTGGDLDSIRRQILREIKA
ncbi:MAG: phosphomethylpyrimidine synthase ThiC, partial [Halobacteriota archaeon]